MVPLGRPHDASWPLAAVDLSAADIELHLHMLAATARDKTMYKTMYKTMLCNH